MTRDFASKSKKRSNATRFTDNKQESISSFKTILMSLLLGVAITLVGVYFYLSEPTEKAVAEETTQPATKPSAKTRYKAVPQDEVQQNDFSFHDELKDKEVEVEVSEISQDATTSDTTYIMQCASFTSNARAEEVKAKIALAGFEAWIRTTTADSGKTHYRVTLGPYKSKRQAVRDRHALERNNINGCAIW
ncbi:MAG: SPOR domain-containing protein [Gammaproteobacteria bacterium]